MQDLNTRNSTHYLPGNCDIIPLLPIPISKESDAFQQFDVEMMIAKKLEILSKILLEEYGKGILYCAPNGLPLDKERIERILTRQNIDLELKIIEVGLQSSKEEFADFSIHLSLPNSSFLLYDEVKNVRRKYILFDPYLSKKELEIRIRQTFPGEDKENSCLTEILDGLSFPGVSQLKPGIRETLDKGETKLVVGYENDVEEKINKIISNLLFKGSLNYQLKLVLMNGSTIDISLDNELLEKSVRYACYHTIHPDDFTVNINKNYKKELEFLHESRNIKYKDYLINIQLPPKKQQKETIYHLLSQIRGRTETLVAIRRLQTLGIITGIKSNDSDRIFDLSITKLPFEEMVNNLERYLQEYLDDEAVNKIIKPAFADPSTDIIAACLKVLVKFVYYHQLKIKERDRSSMINLLVFGQSNKEDFLNQLKKSVQYPFSEEVSTLAQEEIENPANNLHKALALLKQEEAPYFIRNLSHLQSSVEEILPEFPNHIGLRLLKACCTLYKVTEVKDNELVITDQNSYEHSINLILNNLKFLFNSMDVDAETVSALIEETKQFWVNLRQPLEGVFDKITGMFFLLIQKEWTDSFNQNFLIGYDR